MNRRAIASVSALALAAALPLVAGSAHASPVPGSSPQTERSATSDRGKTLSDDRPTPPAAQRATLRQTAVEQLVSGEARLRGKGQQRTIEMADGTLVDYPVTDTAQLLTFLVDFGSGAGNPAFPTQTAGPVHDQIPAPGPQDNSTYWKQHFNRQHYLDMFFNGMPEQDGESFKGIYQEMSSGRFDLEGDVSDWISVDHPASYYSPADGQEGPADMAAFIGDSATAWYDAQVTAGKSDAQIKAYLQQFDQWDRYDSDDDGVYDEPDGYIDHFQAIHAGEGEEAGAPPWAIWSHRSGANYDPTNATGPCAPTECFNPGGVEIGDTGYWIFDYTTEPENGGLGVFAHEFGHDLGLPDYYDTETADSDNGTGFWNLMSAGSWLSHGGATGTTPDHMGAPDKLFLGWYGPGNKDLAITDGLAEEASEVTLGPSNHATTTGDQAVLVDLPDGHAVLDGPVTGSDGYYLYSGNQSSYDALATSPPIAVPDIPSPGFSAHVAYATEKNFDYVYLQVSTDDGATWHNVETSESTDANPNGANLGHGITGGDGSWVDLTADFTPYAGHTIRARWEYFTDGASLGALGFVVDDIGVTDGYSTTFYDPSGWNLVKFTPVADNTYSISYPQSYIAENRQYRGYDSTLEAGPYSWGHNVSAPPFTKSDRFPYQDGLLIWYLNGRYSDNNTSVHPGGGQALPVDANPAVQQWTEDDGDPVAATDSRLQTFDSTFDVDETDPLDLDYEVEPGFTVHLETPAHDSVPVFDDTDVDGYYDDSVDGGEFLSTKVAGTGAMIQVLSSDESTGAMRVKIGSRFAAATTAPAITGDAVYGETLTATPPTWFQDGVDVSDPTWLRDGTPIEGADEASYEIGHADVGHTLSVRYTGTLAGHTATTTESAGVAAAVAPAPAPTTPIAVGGTPQVGQTLTAHGATWPLAGTSTFAWSVGGSPAGTGTTYVVQPGDLGKTVRLTETFQSTDHADATTSAESSTVATGAAPSVLMPAQLGGSAQVGQTLTATGAVWSQPGTSTFAWSVDGTEVGTGTNLTVPIAALGKVVRVTETRTSSGYDAGTTTVDSAVVTAGAAPMATTPPKVAGTARVGSTLTVVGGTWPRAGSSTYAWSIGGRTVGTGTSYDVAAADEGKKVTVTETFTSPGYQAGMASAQSASVAKAPVALKVAVGKTKAGKKVGVVVRATAPGIDVPGKVKVVYGGTSLGLSTLKHGAASVRLPAKKKGDYRLVVTYVPATGFGTASKVITVRVR
ncbi:MULTISPECIES: immune inhibitor A domain-containing protein [unclassified Nocardioides]|uniref:immune inhibitor A domain-containing protein n=1 Tax=unclassified Nocardioides TaxID=2615069 RepID=UPI000B03E948|nr:MULTISPECIES: immune inhibitor A domain-containing protein [unclassified Nocardioides]